MKNKNDAEYFLNDSLRIFCIQIYGLIIFFFEFIYIYIFYGIYIN